MQVPIYFPSVSSSPLFLNLLAALGEAGSGVFLPAFPFVGDLARSFPLSPFLPFSVALSETP